MDHRPCCSSACQGGSSAMIDSVTPRIEGSSTLIGKDAISNTANGGVGALQSARNLFRRLYASSSTLRGMRGGGRRTRKKDNSSGGFQFATSPFFEIRLPQPEERGFLPYNIQYQLVDDDQSSRLKAPIASPPARQSPLVRHFHDPSSPDEGISVSNSSDSSFALNTTPTATLNTNVLDRSINTNGTTTSRSSTSDNHLGMHPIAVSSVCNFDECDDHRPRGQSCSTQGDHPVKCLNSLDLSRTDVMREVGRETVENFSNWDELLQFLKSEITQIRAKDTQIFTNLKKLEVELGSMYRKT